ncbi:hypothetical protein PENSUB_6327 [Penicillium subrubescens]|uniref:Uncharacterized protein n=1 Tax=Penicillium subrubescens TaxID=1316194 RepID=A0A1Q5U1J5_9EURO|nr:hypothetical protein PENSUB_6327 [Penicillium subrubescens]
MQFILLLPLAAALCAAMVIPDQEAIEALSRNHVHQNKPSSQIVLSEEENPDEATEANPWWKVLAALSKHDLESVLDQNLEHSMRDEELDRRFEYHDLYQEDDGDDDDGDDNDDDDDDGDDDDDDGSGDEHHHSPHCRRPGHGSGHHHKDNGDKRPRCGCPGHGGHDEDGGHDGDGDKDGDDDGDDNPPDECPGHGGHHHGEDRDGHKHRGCHHHHLRHCPGPNHPRHGDDDGNDSPDKCPHHHPHRRLFPRPKKQGHPRRKPSHHHDSL